MGRNEETGENEICTWFMVANLSGRPMAILDFRSDCGDSERANKEPKNTFCVRPSRPTMVQS